MSVVFTKQTYIDSPDIQGLSMYGFKIFGPMKIMEKAFGQYVAFLTSPPKKLPLFFRNTKLFIKTRSDVNNRHTHLKICKQYQDIRISIAFI